MFAFLQKIFQRKTPNAAEAWQLAGYQTESAYWLYAAPVHLVLQRDSFSLAAPAPLPLEKDEIEALTNAFNQHFGADGMRFFWHENTWFLSLQYDPQITTFMPQAAINRDVEAFLPTGNGTIKWARFQNEIQMLLFEHPVNEVREAKHMPVINSLWCYGVGESKDAT